MPFRSMLSFVIVTALALNLWTPAFAQAPAPAQSAPPAAQTPAPAQMSPQQRAQAVAGAKTLVVRLIHTSQTGFPPPDLFTNRSAALMGIVMFIPLAFIDAFASMASGKDKAKAKAMDRTIQALSKKYSVDKAGNKIKGGDKAAIAQFESQGRPFYADVIATFNKVMTEAPGNVSKGSKDQDAPTQFPHNIAAYTFTPLSPTDVKISAKNEKVPLEAKLEGGKWRLDLGGVADLNKWMPATKTASAGATDMSSNGPRVMKAPESLFFPRTSAMEAIDNGTTVEFSDNYEWTVADKILVERDGVTDNGRKMAVWLGAKADYYHILNTNLVAIRIHDKSYPRQDTFNDALSGDDTERVKGFITAKPSLVNTQVDMDTPLQKAVFYDHKDMVLLLLSHGAKVNETDDFGQTALMDAAQFDHVDMARLLLAAGAKVNLKNNQGETALSIAKKAHNTGMVALLKQHGAR